jgi:hypothetical protein
MAPDAHTLGHLTVSTNTQRKSNLTNKEVITTLKRKWNSWKNKLCDSSRHTNKELCEHAIGWLVGLIVVGIFRLGQRRLALGMTLAETKF